MREKGSKIRLRLVWLVFPFVTLVAATSAASVPGASGRSPAAETIAYTGCTFYHEVAWRGDLPANRTVPHPAGRVPPPVPRPGRLGPRVVTGRPSDCLHRPRRHLGLQGGRERPPPGDGEPRRGLDDSPSWSPDGRRIVFHREWERNQDLDLTVELYVVHLRTRRVERLTHSPDGWEFDPDWSPDGTHIAFTLGDGDDDDGVFLRELSSGRTSRLTRAGPAVSPLDARRATDRLCHRFRDR